MTEDPSCSTSDSFTLDETSGLNNCNSSVNDSDSEFIISPKRKRTTSTSSSVSSFSKNVTTDAAVPPSPWEWRRMKSELLSLKTRLSHQESTVQQLHKVRHEMEDIFRKEKKVLELQIQQDKQMMKQLELRIENGRKALHDAKTAKAWVERDLSNCKAKLEHKIISLVDENNKLKEELRNKSQEKSLRIPILATEDKSLELQEQLNSSHKRIKELEDTLKEARIDQQKFELLNVQVQNLNLKIHNLESEKAGWEELKQNKACVSSIGELDKELFQAKELIKKLRESVKGKLLLEEQVSILQQKLQQSENLENEILQLEVKNADLKMQLSEYNSIGIESGASGIKKEINRLRSSETLLMAENGQLTSEVESLKRQIDGLKTKFEENKKTENDKLVTIEKMSKLITRLQKKILLVTRERDNYKEQLELLEKEMASESPNPNITAGIEKIPALERIIEGYKELITKLESEIEALDGGQKNENKMLKAEIDRLKGELEHRALKGDFNINSRILHFKMNPAAIAEQQAEEKQKAIMTELEQLRTIVASGNLMGAVSGSSLHAQEMAELQQNYEIKISRLKDAFKLSSHEYRQACYQLFGWRVDRMKEGHYKLSSQYADSPDDYLFFLVNDDGVNMIETEFSESLTALIERHLKIQHSVPMFLNAVQSELFEQQTMTAIVS